MVRVNSIRVFTVVLAVQFGQQLRRGRHSLAGDAILILKLLNKFVVLYKRVVLTADLTTHFNGTVGSLLTVEEVAVIQFHFLNAVEAPHEVQMPVAAAELAIGDGVITSTLLLLDEAGDFLIFHRGQRSMVDLASLELGTCLFQVLGAQEAAHKVITER